MKTITLALLSLVFIQSAFAAKSLCGKVKGLTYNQDTIERPYELSGFWVKQNTRDIRVTFGKSPELIEDIAELAGEGSLFVCLDEYELETKKYAGKRRTYAYATDYRIWLNGSLVD
jgi:hypothetical protein